ncbi:MAG: PilC/PilY family type IV pilus protein [Rhodoferax sp.]
MKLQKYFISSFKSLAFAASALAAVGSSAVVIPNTPLVTQQSAKPLVMLTVGKDHKMYYPSYNDASDLDGDGTIDVGFKPNNPNIVYYGLFDPKLCYTHNGKSDNTGLFTPDSTTSTGKCPGKWSGLWLNYITTSRMDALRRVLYGGMREVDSTTQTILRRAYIPADAHSWGNEYTSEAVDGYKISDYTPFAQPTASNKRHFFGSLTSNYSQNCATLDDCSNKPPLLRVRTNVGDNHRIWEWASKERPVLASNLSTGAFPTGTDAEKNYTVRVEVCTASFHNGCKLYPNGQYKPTGILHDYGENDAMLFGLLTGSYDNHMTGGRLRKVVSSFKDEVNSTTGQFTAVTGIVYTLDKLRIRGFNQNNATGEYWKSSPYTDSAKFPTEGQLVDWGNPIAEIMYESVRYFAGKNSATSGFNTSTTFDTAVGISSATWDDPYSSSSAAKAPWCAKPSMLTISDVYPSFDSDKVPGSAFSSFAGDLSGLNVKNEADTITAVETSTKGMHFIGETEAGGDNAPTAKNVTSLGKIRGLAPGEPGKQGTYYSASVAYFAKRADLRPGLTGKPSDKTVTVDTFVVALASPLPKITVPVNGKTVTLVPFSKTVAGSGVSATKGNYQPTNQIVKFYVLTMKNSGTTDIDTGVNGGRYYAQFLINYEDVEQGGDHDMDAIAVYEVKADSGGTVSVTVTPTYQAGGMKQNMGYVISGTTKDGVYLVAQDETGAQNYFLNVPAGKSAGYCDVTTPPAGCDRLPTIGETAPTFVFTPSSTPAATLLNDPLWYAAKWGSFKDDNKNGKPDTGEWDSRVSGSPDNYFLVQNPSKLPEQLKKAFDNIAAISSSASNVISNSTSTSANKYVYQSRFDSSNWSGDMVAYPFTGSGVSTTPAWKASSKVLSDTGRRLYYLRSDGVAKEFKWSNLTTADQTSLVDVDTLDYVRGVRGKESQNSGGTFRNRPATVLGDIVNSSPYYETSTDVVYVGGNDGMLHAFKASDGSTAGSAGTELFGFIPAEVVSRLKNRASVNYVHDHYVDGDVVVSPRASETSSKNYLVATLGRGGKGLFALDVTAPATFDESKFLWEYTPTASTTAAADNDLGYMIGRPSYVKLNNGKGAIIVGNGYNSTSGSAVLYVFILKSDGSIDSVKKFDTGIAGDNGLSTPTAFDSDNNGTIDYVYAGDLKGNVWKFDLSSASDTAWAIANTGSPMFTAKDSGNTPQPITAPMSIAVDPVAGDPNKDKRFVFFGTGSYFKTGDPADAQVNTWYALIDEGSVISGRSALKQRTVSTTTTFDGKSVRSFSSATAGDMTGKKGWYVDLSTSTYERIVTKSVYANFVSPTLIASSIIPNATDQCASGGKGFVNFIDPFSGAALTGGTIDVNNNGNFADDSAYGSVDLGVGMPSEPIVMGDRVVVGGTDADNPVSSVKVNLGNKRKGRIAWREIIKD